MCLTLSYLPLNWDDRKRDSVGGYGITHDPNTALAGDGVLPNKIRLTGTEEVRRTRDMPLNRDRGQTDNRGEAAALHDPETVLASGCILPNEAGLAGAQKVCHRCLVWVSTHVRNYGHVFRRAARAVNGAKRCGRVGER